MADSLSVFDEHYQVEYRRLMLKKRFSYPLVPGSEELVGANSTFARNASGLSRLLFKTGPDVFTKMARGY